MDELLKRIAEIRKSKGLTQTQVSEKIGVKGVARNSYNKIETGKTELTVNHLIKIAGALGVSVVSLIDPDAQPKDYFQELNAKIEALEKTIREKDEYILIQKHNVNNIKTYIVVFLSMAQNRALNIIAEKFEKLTQKEEMMFAINYTNKYYLEFLKAHDIIGQKDIDLYIENQREYFHIDLEKLMSDKTTDTTPLSL
ncbi:MAG: helix-turn-helix transcriptional regulator [Bacteroidetes bacterium]|nr:helix-turn-helix transcriptional regulator [Bacteroidota bacterium]